MGVFLACKGVTVLFGDATVGLADISVEIAEGELVVLEGPSGAGKPTFLALWSRLVVPQIGTVFVDQADLRSFDGERLRLWRRSIGIIHQDLALLEKRTVGENVAYAHQISLPEDRDDSNRMAGRVLDRVGIGHLADRYPNELSGGERQRVLLAQALVRRPRLVLADEPTTNLDPTNAQYVMTLLTDTARAGATVVIASHCHEAHNLSTRRLVFDSARILQGAVGSGSRR